MSEKHTMPNRDKWFDIESFNYVDTKTDDGKVKPFYCISKDFNRLVAINAGVLYRALMQRFKAHNLPDDLPEREVKMILSRFGYGTLYPYNGKMYIFNSSLGGELDEYYHYTLSIVNNPYLKLFKQLKVNQDCVVVLNDSLYMGYNEIIMQYASIIANLDISIYYKSIQARISSISKATDDNTANSIQSMWNHLEYGDTISSIKSNAFINNYSQEDLHNNTGSTNIKDLMELKQYYWAHAYMSLGLSAPDNMKRESLTAGEIDATDEVLIPDVDDVLECWNEGFKKAYEKFPEYFPKGQVYFTLNSAWKFADKERNLTLEDKEAQLTDTNVSENEVVENDSKTNESESINNE